MEKAIKKIAEAIEELSKIDKPTQAQRTALQDLKKVHFNLSYKSRVKAVNKPGKQPQKKTKRGRPKKQRDNVLAQSNENKSILNIGKNG